MSRPSRRSLRAASAPLLAAGVLALLAAPLRAESTGSLRGRVALEIEGVRLDQVRPVVVYLEPAGASPGATAAVERATVHQRNARFSPGFLVVSVGQTVDMPNDDEIYHNVFSFSRPNAFDLGLYASGESRQLVFRHPGVVNLYCSIHESMNGTIFVAPTPWFDEVSSSGHFEIAGVPPGRYRVRTWSERLPETETAVAIRPGESIPLELPIGAGQ
jgi:plastocyanin